MSSLKIPRKTIVILNILCILLPSPTLYNLVTGLKTQKENLKIPGGTKFHFPNIETGIQLAANADNFQDGTFPIASQMKSPSYQHKLIRLHGEPGTGSVRIRYPLKQVLSHYMLSQPLRHPIAGRPDIVVNGNVFPWVLNDDEDNYKQTFHPTNFPAGTPSMIPYGGARSLTNITMFLHRVHHNLHAIHGRNRYGNRKNDEQLELLADHLRLNLRV